MLNLSEGLMAEDENGVSARGDLGGDLVEMKVPAARAVCRACAAVEDQRRR